jgi:hypothetical protein
MGEQKQIKRDPRTRFTLENWARIAFHPKGARGFMEGMNTDLDLGPIQSSFNRGVGTAFDVMKYLTYFAFAGRLVYEAIKNYS